MWFQLEASNQFSVVSLGPDPEQRPAGYSNELKTDVKVDRAESCVCLCVCEHMCVGEGRGGVTNKDQFDFQNYV